MTTPSDPDPAALVRLKETVRKRVRHNAFLWIREYRKSITPVIWIGTLILLAGFRVLTLLGFVVAWQGWLIDPQYCSHGVPVQSPYTTPFHHHPNLFGWRYWFQGLVSMHNLTGIALFAVCLLPLFVMKGSKIHVRFGRAFVVFWLLHLFDGLVNSAQILMVRGLDPRNYLDRTHQGFSLYLYLQFAFISSMVIDFLALGLSASQYKNQPPSRWARILMIAFPATSMPLGIGLVLWGLKTMFSSEPPASPDTMKFAVIFVVQIPAYAYLVTKNLVYWIRANPERWLHGWVLEHQRNMMFCVQVTLYTGIANATMRFAPWLTAVAFGSIDVGFVVWLLVKEKAIRKAVVRSRLALAFLSALSSKQTPAQQHSLAPADLSWIMKLCGLEHGGILSPQTIHTLLTAQGIHVANDELQTLANRMDRNQDGAIDSKEFVEFLSTWFIAEPQDEDELLLVFRKLDTDRDGRLSLAELRAALGQDAHPSRTQEIDQLFASVDTNQNGTLEWEEFRSALLTQAA